MKNILLIIGLLIGLFLFAPDEGAYGDREDGLASASEAVMKEKSSATDVQHHLEILSNELKDSNCLTPRRVLQTTSNASTFRIHHSVEKLLQAFRLRNTESLCRTTANLSVCQTSQISTLFCRMAQHVYVLRKLII